MFLEDITDEKLIGLMLVYGPAGTGKTTVCLEALHGRSVYLSSSKNFSAERLQAMRSDAQEILTHTVVFEPGDILGWERAVGQAVQISALSSVIILDSVATPVRAAERRMGNLGLHRMLETLKKSACPVIVTSEVYDFTKDELKFVGGDMLRLAARTIIELRDGTATVRKHPLVAGRVWKYRIEAAGLRKL